ncbi:MAG: energy-coupling factor transporter transmembrane protein EcfT [Deltaproteobacteria bacterium]|nr:energy-coupling factor transporter transmembrane protein EcfT [Deltaproteobacteria bacterium]MBW2121227.1 energy-coupling factor transporter transmembrane protein EcfT [Deltaproteobacteria bacterium]
MPLPSDKVIREILGKKGETWLHMLDPRVKIIWFGLMFATGFIILDNVAALFLLFLYILILGRLAGVTQKQMTMIKIVLPLFVIVVFFNIFLLPIVRGLEQKVIVEFPFKYPWYYLSPHRFSPSPVVITRESLYMGVTRGMVLLTFSAVASLFILLIEVTEMIEGMMLLRVPYKLAFTCGLAVNYIPVLFNDLSTIAEAQKARGHRLDKGGTLSRLRASVSLLLPAINCAYIRAGNIADSMNARAFGARAERTTLVERRFKNGDWYFLIANTGILCAGILVNLFGGMGIFIRF